jgi:hypothetical protein
MKDSGELDILIDRGVGARGRSDFSRGVVAGEAVRG